MARLPSVQSAHSCHFRDGLGDRWLRKVGASDTVEVLGLCRELATMRSAIRDRFGRLATLRLAQFVPVRDIVVLSDGSMGVEVLSDFVPGHRLSDILAAAHAGRLVISTDAALHVV